MTGPIVSTALFVAFVLLLFVWVQVAERNRAKWAQRVAASKRASEEQRAERLEREAHEERERQRAAHERAEREARNRAQRGTWLAALHDTESDYTGQPIRTPEERADLLARIRARREALRFAPWPESMAFYDVRAHLAEAIYRLERCVYTNPNEGMLL